MTPLALDERKQCAERADALFARHYATVTQAVDRAFLVLIVLQWFGAVAFAWWSSPRTWEGGHSSLHIHVLVAIVLGGSLCGLTSTLVRRMPGTPLTRHVIAAVQALFSALFIHISNGRIETHFHVFGSLAFLATYRDARVLLTSATCVAIDHYVRGSYFPQSVFGTPTPGQWRWLEHVSWVGFEGAFLAIAANRSRREMHEIAQRRAELEVTHDSIERQVRERTQECAIARDDAVRALGVKAEFLANMSHELRTPLNGIIGVTGLLLSTKLDAEQQEYGSTIRSSSEALLWLINDILDYSKLEAGKVELERVAFDLREVLDETTAMLATRASEKNLELLCDVFNDVPSRLVGDPRRLRQVLANLLANAIKFTERGEVEITVTRERETDDRVWVCFAVRDTGVGIPDSARNRLFQSFTQVDASTTRRYGGSGLGLAISRRLVEAMGGTIAVDSEPGVGSTFRFRVPLIRDVACEFRAPTIQRGEHRAPRVLVVDDNAHHGQVVERRLARGSWRTTRLDQPASAPDALVEAAASGDPYAIALIDSEMPGIDGLQLAKTLRALDVEPRPRIVLMAAVNHLGAAMRERELDAVVTKPIRDRHLHDVLTSLLTTARTNPEPGSGPAPDAAHPALAGMRALVAEDNKVNQMVVLRVLKRLGVRADAVTSGDAAVVAIATKHYDIVLMDGQMPVMDGYDATRAIRAQERAGEHVPIIALTANALAGDRERCLDAGMDDYLAKPVQPERLAEKVMQWLHADAMRPAEPSRPR